MLWKLRSKVSKKNKKCIFRSLKIWIRSRPITLRVRSTTPRSGTADCRGVTFPRKEPHEHKGAADPPRAAPIASCGRSQRNHRWCFQHPCSSGFVCAEFCQEFLLWRSCCGCRGPCCVPTVRQMDGPMPSRICWGRSGSTGGFIVAPLVLFPLS